MNPKLTDRDGQVISDKEFFEVLMRHLWEPHPVDVMANVLADLDIDADPDRLAELRKLADEEVP